MRAAVCLRDALRLSALAALAACADTQQGGGGGFTQVGPVQCAPGDVSCQSMNPQAQAGVGALPMAGTGGGIAPGAAGTAATAGTGGQPGTSTGGATGVPCDVATIVSEHCTLCHGAQRVGGAPMLLVTLADFHAPAPSNPARKVYEVIPERIGAQEIGLRMPPASSAAMPQPEIEAMNAWITAGAMGGTCQIGAAPDAGGTGGSTAPPPGPSGSGGISEEPITYDDPLMECHEFRAHAPSDKTQPYSVPTTPDYYVNFDFMPPWDGSVYTRSYEVVLDNPEVVHHWLFYRNSGPKTDGNVSQSSGVHPDGTLLHGWAPGGSDTYFHSDVGAELSGTTSYTLELHYNNTGGAAAPDASGIRVCYTPTRPEFVASLSWLGTDNINGTMAQGTCDPTTNEPIRIIGGNPHMHTKGNRMQVVLNLAAGGQEVLHDMPFDFEYQRGYVHDFMIQPGDTITTTCYYNSPAQFGEGTGDEMCYWFAMHYPAMGLTNGNFIANAIHGPNTCLN